MKEFEVAIIGASVSGASLAVRLGGEGVTTAIVDKDCFPRRKACGEGLSNVALDALDRMGFATRRLLALGVSYYAYRIDLGSRSFEFAVGSNRRLKGLGVQREVLDQLLLDEVSRCPSVTTFQGCGTEGISRRGERFEVALANGESFIARNLVLADGAHSVNAMRLGIPVRRRTPLLWGISFIMEGAFTKVPDEVHVILKKGFEINCTPVARNRLNVTFLTERAQVKALQDEALRQELLSEAVEKMSFLGRALNEPLQVGPVSAGRRTYVHDSVMLLGDAAENLDPVAGMGMTHGILMAEIAADSLLSMFRGELGQEAAHRGYAARAGKMTRTYRGFTRLTASLLRSPLRKVLLPPLAATFLPGMIRTALDDSSISKGQGLSLPQHFLGWVGA